MWNCDNQVACQLKTVCNTLIVITVEFYPITSTQFNSTWVIKCDSCSAYGMAYAAGDWFRVSVPFKINFLSMWWSSMESTLFRSANK